MNRYESIIHQLIDAWEATKPGHTTGEELQRWLVEDMKPAIDAARKQVGREVPKS